MLPFSTFTVFGSETLGKNFFPKGLAFDNAQCFIPTIAHGRSVSFRINDFDWIQVKGVGWNYGGPCIYVSPKEPEFIFGVYPFDAAKREKELSDVILTFSSDFPKVIEYREISEFDLPKEYSFLKSLRFSTGRLVRPTLLYTKVKCPFRVADLAYFTDEEKKKIIQKYSCFWGIESKDFLYEFAKQLGANVSLLHSHMIINDTLEYSNVTLLAEIVDYELITCPGIPFEDGTDGLEMMDERKEKELLYAAEVVLLLGNLLHEDISIAKTYSWIIDEYKKLNADFLERRKNIMRFYQNEEIIL